MATDASEAPDLVLVGCGLRADDHLTREAERSLREARVIFHSVYSRGLAERLRALNPDARLERHEDGEYMVGQYRPDMYRRMADRALEEAARGPGVAVLHPGSATVADAIAGRLLAGAAARRLRVRVLPGISSVELVLAEMGWDAAEGLQVIAAQNLVLHDRRLDPTQAAIVIQPGYYDTLWYAGVPQSQPGRFDALRRQLGLSHPDEAPMALVLGPIAAEDSAHVLWFRLGSLAELEPAISPFHTLFVPPVAEPTVDPAFAARVASWEELVSRLRLDDHRLPRQADARRWFEGGSPPGVGDDLLEQSDALAAAWARARRPFAGPKMP